MEETMGDRQGQDITAALIAESEDGTIAALFEPLTQPRDADG